MGRAEGIVTCRAPEAGQEVCSVAGPERTRRKVLGGEAGAVA